MIALSIDGGLSRSEVKSSLSNGVNELCRCSSADTEILAFGLCWQVV